MLSAIGTAVWQNLPAILELKKIMGYFTPVGVVALYLGVPTIVITALLWIIKRATRSI